MNYLSVFISIVDCIFINYGSNLDFAEILRLILFIRYSGGGGVKRQPCGALRRVGGWRESGATDERQAGVMSC